MKRWLSELFEYNDIEWSNKKVKIDDTKNYNSTNDIHVECIGNTIYFCSPVNKLSIYELTKIIQKKWWIR